MSEFDFTEVGVAGSSLLGDLDSDDFVVGGAVLAAGAERRCQRSSEQPASVAASIAASHA